MLICIDGVVGSGKSTLQKILCERYMGKLFIQEFENHPYLEKFYSNPKKYAIEKIMIFLFMGYHQLANIQKSGLVISDFTFEKSLAFGKIDLLPNDYDNLLLPSYNYLVNRISKPDLLIYLIGSTELIKARIQKRGRKMELGISNDYLEALDKAYKSIFMNYTESPVLKVDVCKCDFHYNVDLKHLFERIEEILPNLIANKNPED